jgi:hypothetical protein
VNARPTDPAEEFQIGDLVKYVPYHAHGNGRHPDCETGKVTSLNSAFVFVRFSGSTSQACNPDQLRLIAR